MPEKTQKCPCRSKKTYKNCACFKRDQERKDEFIGRMGKQKQSMEGMIKLKESTL
jgi:hypothetical protein